MVSRKLVHVEIGPGSALSASDALIAEKKQPKAAAEPALKPITTKPIATKPVTVEPITPDPIPAKPIPPKSISPKSISPKSITTMAFEYGITLRALRFYEERGMITPSRVGNERLYRPSDELKVRLILDGKRLGFSLLEIEELLVRFEKALVPSFVLSESLSPEEIEQQLKSLVARRDSVESAIRQLEGLR